MLRPPSRRFLLAIANTGCRLKEICRLNVRDVDFERRLLRVVRKGSRIDFVPINETLFGVIEEELEGRDAEPTDPLFLNQQGNRFRGIRKPLETACPKLEIPRVTHHGLRHAYTTILLD